MRLLLDTHTQFWSVDNPSKVSATATAALQDSNNDRLLSAQALVDGIAIVSVDVAFDSHGVTRIW